MTIPADAAGKQETIAGAAGNREITIPAWREASVPSLHPEVHADAKKKSKAKCIDVQMKKCYDNKNKGVLR